MENNYFFIKSTYQNTDQKEGCFCNLYNITLYYCKRRKFQFIWLNAIIQHEESLIGSTGKLQVTLLSAYISRKKLCSQISKPYPKK